MAGPAASRRGLILICLICMLMYILTRSTKPASHPSGRRPLASASLNRFAQPQRQLSQEELDGWGWDSLAGVHKRVKEKLTWGQGGSWLGNPWQRYQQEVDEHLQHQTTSVLPAAPGSGASIPVETEPTDPLAYRHHLEAEHGPHSYKTHNPTLTFDHIYVLSLPHRTDRRERMSKIAKALGLEFTFVDATVKTAPIITWIAERVKEIRDRKRTILAQALGIEPEKVGGLDASSVWLRSEDKKKGLILPDLAKLDDRWYVPNNGPHPGPYPIHVDWVRYLETGTHEHIRPSRDDIDVTSLLHDPVEPYEARQLNAAAISTWYSQTRVWKQMLANGDKTALIMEDDVDIEWDFERMWPNVERSLPEGWDIVFLGHCWGQELSKSHYVHPLLHQSSQPRCLHGYVLSAKGAKHLSKLFSNPWIAYQTPVDTYIAYLSRIAKDVTSASYEPSKKDGDLQILAFSMEPQVIVQMKELASDIQVGVGSVWKGLLADSTWDRILRDEGKEVAQLTWKDVKGDPAVKPRPWSGRRKQVKLGSTDDSYPQESIIDGAAHNTEYREQVRAAKIAAAEAAKEARAAAKVAQAKARLEAMARPLYAPEELERQEALKNLPKQPVPLALGKKRPVQPKVAIIPAETEAQANREHAAEEIRAAIEAMRRGDKVVKKGDSNRVGTGGKRVGPAHDI